MLKTDYSNDVFDGNRKYQITDNSDGTKSIEDVTKYTNEGDVFGAEDINATNKAVNGIMSSTADAYNPESTYSSGDYCIQNNALYKANQDIDTPEEWTAGHWDATTVAEELDLLNQNMSVIFKVQTFTTSQRSIAGLSATAIMFTVTPPDGYSLVGAVGFYTGSTEVVPIRLRGDRMDVRNVNSAPQTVAPTITVLFSKIAMIESNN